MEDRYQRYQNTAFTSQQWYIIKKAIDDDIEVKDIACPRFSVEQLTLLIDARRSGIDLSGLTDPDIKEEQLKQILEKIANEMGLYDEHYEKVRRKWFRNITWMLIIGSVITIIASMLYITKDEWLKYFEELYLSFDRETVQLEAGEPFEPASYIRSYDPEAVITFPNRDEIDTKKPGTYWAVYHISNGKKEKDMKLLVEVKDTKAPVISLNRSSVTVSDRSDLKAKDYIDSVMDIVDGDLLSKTTTKITKDKIIYEVADKHGNKARKTLDIHIEKPKSDKAENVPKTEIPQKDTMTQQKQEAAPVEKDVPVIAQSRSSPFVEGRSFDQHSSLVIDTRNNAMFWNTEHINGSALEYLRKAEGKTFPEAMNILIEYHNGLAPDKKQYIAPKYEQIEFKLPDSQKNISKIYEYLCDKRKIDRDLIKRFVDDGKIYLDAKGNCVFACENYKGKVDSAFVRSTYSGFRGDVGGGNKFTGFFIEMDPKATKLVLTEAYIDGLSYITAKKQAGEKIDFNVLACDSCNVMNETFRVNYLTRSVLNQNIDTVILASDNDKAGRAAAEEFKAFVRPFHRIQNVIDDLPSLGSDWNKDLQKIYENPEAVPEKAIMLK